MSDDNEGQGADSSGAFEQAKATWGEVVPEGAISQGADGQPGAKVGDAIAGQLASLTANILLMVTRLLPFSAKFWRGLINAGDKGMAV